MHTGYSTRAVLIILNPVSRPNRALPGPHTQLASSRLQNTFGTSGPAVAVRVAGDRAAFYGCRFTSFQDTLLDDTGRHYYRGCYVQGGTDFVFGNGKALFDVRAHP